MAQELESRASTSRVGTQARLGLALVLLVAAACAAKPTPSSQDDDDDVSAAGGGSAVASGGASATGGMAQVGGGAAVTTGGTGGQAVGAGGTATGVGGSGYGASTSGGATGLGGAQVNPNQACPTAQPGILNTNRLWVDVSFSVGGYLITITVADSSSATFQIECPGDPIALVRDGIQATLAGDPVVVDIPEDSKRISLRYLSFTPNDGPSDEVGAEMIISQL